jgi:predicted ATP-grasp superfamily ATP-dependent carboligase
MTPRVLVTDGEERSALAACRGLASAGYAVSALARVPLAGALWSSACSERFVGPDPKRSADAFVARVEELLRRRRYACVVPGSDASLIAMSRRRERLEPFAVLGFPPQDVVERSLDKVALHREAASTNLAAPHSVTCEALAEAGAAAREVGFPLVVKPPRTLRPAAVGIRQQRVLVARDERQLHDALAGFGVPFILQRLLDGARRFSFGGVMTDDGILGRAVARFDRTWPPPAGAVSFGETAVLPAGVAATIESMLRRIGWRGIFELEYLESADGRRYAIDLNPRVFGWLALATAAGANLAALWCGSLLGERPATATARAGVLYRWEEADVAHLAWQLRRGRVREAAAVARPHRAVVHAHFRLRDPGPLLARALRLAADRVV